MARIPIHDHSDLNSGGKLRVSSAIQGGVEAISTPSPVPIHGALPGLGNDDHPHYVRKTEGGQETINPIGTTGAAEDIDPTLGNVVTATLGDDTVFTLLEPVGSAATTLEVWVDTGAGGFTPTFDTDGGAFVWNGTTPTLPTTAGVVYRVIVERIPATTNDWVGDLVGGSGGSALTVEDEGTPLATDATSLDFVGAGVTASGTGAAKTITIPGVTEAGVRDAGRWEPVTDGDIAATELVFEDGDVVMEWVPG